MARRITVRPRWGAPGVVAAALLLAACTAAPSGTDPDDTPATAPADDGAPTNFLDLTVGDCFDMPSTLADGEALKFSSCETPHLFEAYAETSLPDGEFPGDDEIEARAAAFCEPAFVEFVGESWTSSEFDFQYIVPSERTWTEVDDRSILCLVTTLSALPWTGTAEGDAA